MAHDDTASEDWSISRSCSTAYSTNKSFTSTDSDSDSETLSSHSTKLNVLIYVQHCRTLKIFTPAEQQEVLNTMPYSIQDEIKCKLDHVGPIAAIYLDNSTTSEATIVYTITLNGMQHLYRKLNYLHKSKRTLKYTLALIKDVQPYASPLTQIYNSNHLIDTYKASIMSESNPNHQCSKCDHSYRKRSALARHTKTRHPIKNKNSHDNNLQKEIFTPPILEEASCPSTYKIYWNLKAKTRKVHARYTQGTRLKSVAPRFPLTMLQLAEEINFPGNLLSREFLAYAEAYDNIIKQYNYSSEVTISQYKVGVTNSVQDLSLTGQTRILESLKKKAPKVQTKTLNKVSEAELTHFFFEARTFMLTNSIPWDSFSDYFITPTILGKEIYGKVTNTLKGYPTHTQLIKNFTCFIEHIMLRLLPAQESYNDAEARIIEEHKAHLLGPSPNIDHTRTMLQSDSRDLVTKSPYYKQVQNEIPDESKRMMIENESTNLLHKIIAHTLYDAEIHKLLIGSECYKEITDIPNNVLLDYIQSLIVAEDKSARAIAKLSLD